MGFSGINLTQLLVILAIVIVVFGTKRVKSLGGDLGEAIKGFRRAVNADDDRSRGYADEAARPPRIETNSEAASDASPLSGQTTQSKPS